MNNQDTRFANQYAIQWFPGHMAKTCLLYTSDAADEL